MQTHLIFLLMAVSARGVFRCSAAGTAATWRGGKTIQSAITTPADVVKLCAASANDIDGDIDIAGDAVRDSEVMGQFASGRKARQIRNDVHIGNTSNNTTNGAGREVTAAAAAAATAAPNVTSNASDAFNDWMTKKQLASAGGGGGGGVGGGGGGSVVENDGSAKKLHFPPAPAGERIHHDAAAAPLVLPLAAFTTLLDVLQPYAVPLETLKEAIQGRLAFHALLLQMTKMEALIVLWSVCWLIAAAYVPYATLSELCCRRGRQLQRHSSVSSLENVHAHKTWSNAWHTIILNVILLLLIASVGLMLAGSEQAHRSIAAAAGGGRGAVVFGDVERFARNSEMQIAFVTATSLEIALAAVDKDLQDAENLLGKPIKETFGEYYNLDNTFLALKLIQQDSIEISKTVAAIKATCVVAVEAGDRLQRRLDDLVPLVRNIRQVCADHDGPLCETITENGLITTFDVKELMKDGKVIYLGGISSQPYFNASLHEAEMNYQGIARKIALETLDQRTAIRSSLERHRVDIHKQLRRLEDTSRSMITSIRRAGAALAPYRATIAAWEQWRYLLTFVLVITLFGSWTCLMCGAPCCCTKPRITCAVLSASLAVISAILSWLLATAMLLMGVHGGTFICRPLYDAQYATLTAILDDGGLLIPQGGLLKLHLNLNEPVRIADALRAMENNKTVYMAFNLKALVDLDALTDHRQWADVAAAVGGVRVQRELQILTPPLENALLDFTSAGGVNLTLHRAHAARPTVGRDLHALLDQLYATAKFLRDGRTKGRIENLAHKLRDVVEHEHKALNDIQDRLIYHITALDVLLKPLVRRAELVLLNLAKFQQAMNVELGTIAKNHVVNYTNGLEDYLAQFRANVLYEIKHRTAKTGPLWHIFAAIRVTLCDGCVDGINALSFASYLSLLALVCLQPVLWTLVRRTRQRNASVILHRSASEKLVHRNPHDWQTPRENQGAGSPDTIVRDLEESVWVSPRQPSEMTLGVGVEHYATAGTARSSPSPPSAIGFDRTNWNIESITRDRIASPVTSATRRWI